jgi:nucleotide-binding universal stress UspA family protein
MKRGMKILVAYDGSSHADNALIEAIDIAKCFNAHLELIHCSWEHSKEAGRVLLLSKEGDMKKAGIKYKIRNEVAESPGQRLTTIVYDEGFSLVVMGTRGMGTVKDLILGSVSNFVIDKVNVPVLVVK